METRGCCGGKSSSLCKVHAVASSHWYQTLSLIATFLTDRLTKCLYSCFDPQVFDRSETFRIVDTPLPSPVTTRVLRIIVLTWNPSDDELCLDLEALGCLAESCELGMQNKIIAM